MATKAHAREWSGPSRRRVPRFPLKSPMDVTVLRSGVADKVPGRSVNLCERGIAVVLAGELANGESVGIEVSLPQIENPIRTRAVVRHQDGVRCGFEFLELSPPQRTTIRDWTKGRKEEGGIEVDSPAIMADGIDSKSAGHAAEELTKTEEIRVRPIPDSADSANSFRRGAGGMRAGNMGWIFFLAAALVLAFLFWWRWNRGWEQLESGLKRPSVIEKPQMQVPAEEMEKLLVHRVEPAYPAEARQQGVQGVIALDVIIGRDGSVLSMRPLNGPEVLARAAMDALRWWKFQPYLVNGNPAVVESRMAVEFKP